uniref:Uncharacterized protein n=1 Tax=Moschus moschiferus TaxID=68415 RepID=A0A8C6G0Z7_MOSMO
VASPSLEPLLALGLPLLLACWGRVGGQAVSTTSASENTTTTPSGPSPGSNGALSQEATTAIMVFSLLAALLLAVGLDLLVRKPREKRQTEGTYWPSSEEQFSHAELPEPPPSLPLPRASHCPDF